MITREHISQYALSLIERFEIIILEFCTGLGKSKIAIDFINLNSDKKFLLVLFQISYIENWKREFDKWNMNHLLDNVDIVLYASLHKYENKEYYGVIYDEAHHLFAPTYSKASRTIIRSKSILLSATISDSSLSLLGITNPQRRFNYQIDKFTTIEFNRGILFVFSLSQAQDNEILNRPKIIIKEINLGNYKNPIIFNPSKKKIVKFLYKELFIYLKDKHKYKENKVIIDCTELEHYEYLSNRVDYFQNIYFKAKENKEKMKFLWLKAANTRKDFLANVKFKYVKKLLTKVNHKRFVLFGNSISQIERLGDNFIHSKRKDSLSIIDKFNNKEINSLLAVGMLQEGANLVDIDICINIQLGSSSREFIQKLGRVLRNKVDPTLFLFKVLDTEDENYFNKHNLLM